METMKELTGIKWPLSDKEKIKLRTRRLARREKLLSNPENQHLYDEIGLAYDVAEQLYKARIEADLTQRELAEKMHTSQSNLARIERGQNITLSTLDAYARICGRNVKVQLV
jgi:ribosome-binding protein aMBF1 (putative translation factor)